MRHGFDTQVKKLFDGGEKKHRKADYNVWEVFG